jgi:integrase
MAFGKVRKRTIGGIVRYTVEWRDPFGRRCQRKFADEADAQRWADSPQVKGQAGLQPHVALSGTRTLQEWVNYWLSDFVPVTRAPKTARSYRDTMQRFILPKSPANPHAIGHLPVAGLTVAHMVQLLTWWKGQGYAADSLRIMWATTSASLTDAVDYQLLSFNPLGMKPKSIKRLLHGDETEVRKAFTQEQANQFLFAAKASPLYAQFLTGLDAGLRIAEWRALQLPDVLLGDSILTVNRQLAETGTTVGPTKGKRRREVALSNRLRTLLGKVIQERPALVLKRGWRPAPPWVFVTRNGTPYGQRNVQEEFARVLTQAGLADQGFSCHSLRHTFACLHLANAKDVNIVQWVQQQLGHASILTTMQYSKTIRIHDPAAADRLELLVHGDAHATQRATKPD